MYPNSVMVLDVDYTELCDTLSSVTKSFRQISQKIEDEPVEIFVQGNHYGYENCPDCGSEFNNQTVGVHGEVVAGVRILHDQFRYQCLGCDFEFGPKIRRTKRRGNIGVRGPVEKNRPTQNGITRPSTGGKCYAIWQFNDKYLEENGSAAKIKDVKSWAIGEGHASGTIALQTYNWRKFNGITGRV